MSNVVDTLLNIEVFAFIGLLIWLYMKPDTALKTENADPSSETLPDDKSG